MTLSAGNQLYKVDQKLPVSTILQRLQLKATMLGDPDKLTLKDLSEALCPGESYIVHEVVENVNYTNLNFDQRIEHVMGAKGVTLKVVY